MQSWTISQNLNPALSKIEYDAFRKFLEETTGLVLGDDKAYLILSRLSTVFEKYQLNNCWELLQKLKLNEEVDFRNQVIDALMNNETYWFRDEHPYVNFSQNIVPLLQQDVGGTLPLKVWSNACSSGQEPYSLSLCCSELKALYPKSPPNVEILGTDISQTMIKQAERGIYDCSLIHRGLSVQRQHAFFEPTVHPLSKLPALKIKDPEKNRVIFKKVNLLEDFSGLGQFHVIFCRNVLLYFSDQTKKAALERLTRALLPGGALVLGASELLDPASLGTLKLKAEKSSRGLFYLKERHQQG